MHTRETIQKEVIIMANKFEALAGLFASLSSYTAATTATADEIKEEIKERTEKQEALNKRYDAVKKALKTADPGLTEEDLEEQLLDMGLEKVSMVKFKKGLKNKVVDELNNEKRKITFGAISEIKQLTSELGDLLEEEPAPKTPMEKMLEQQTVMLNQMFLNQNGYQAPAPTATDSAGVTWSANLLEKSRLTKERDAKISEIRALKKAGGISALEMAQAIAGINSEYKTKLGNI